MRIREFCLQIIITVFYFLHSTVLLGLIFYLEYLVLFFIDFSVVFDVVLHYIASIRSNFSYRYTQIFLIHYAQLFLPDKIAYLIILLFIYSHLIDEINFSLYYINFSNSSLFFSSNFLLAFEVYLLPVFCRLKSLFITPCRRNFIFD